MSAHNRTNHAPIILSPTSCNTSRQSLLLCTKGENRELYKTYIIAILVCAYPAVTFIISPYNGSDVGMEDTSPYNGSDVGMEDTSPYNGSNVGMEDTSPYNASNVGMGNTSPYNGSNVGISRIIINNSWLSY